MIRLTTTRFGGGGGGGGRIGSCHHHSISCFTRRSAGRLTRPSNDPLGLLRAPSSHSLRRSIRPSGDGPLAPLQPLSSTVHRSILSLRSTTFVRPSSSSSSSSTDLPRGEIILSSPLISYHLLFVAALVFAIVVVGGYTRLSESGLSITEWNLVTGILPPSNQAEWEIEFEKYRSSPEFKILNHSIGLEEFKRIYFWEWYHRILGRFIGLSFLIPIPFFLRSHLIRTSQLRWSLLAIGTLIGLQGGLGWYMVKSGIDQVELDRRDGIPRVSHYRLAAHLLMAFTVYSACINLAGGIWRDWRLGYEYRPLFDRVYDRKLTDPIESIKLLNSRIPCRARFWINSLTALIFLTAGSGAFVAGLDAGLVYNTFPKMGDRWIPSKQELISDVYSDRGSQGTRWERASWIRNVFENPTTVQFDHRVLGTLTFLSTLAWSLLTESKKRSIPRSTWILSRWMVLIATNQVGLGVSTLLYLVPTHLALLHQANSLLLLSFALLTRLSLRRPTALALKSFYQNSPSILNRSLHKAHS